jgi:exodeoxyribonuclease VII small subunit
VERDLTVMSARATKKDATPEFERTLAELEETVRRLEAGDLPLEESLGAFEKGVALVRTLHARLDAVQMRIDELVQSPQAGVALAPLDAGLIGDDAGEDESGDE